MGGSTWVQNKTELFEGELVVFQRANSPNYYMRVYVAKESKHYQKSLRTKSQYEAIEIVATNLVANGYSWVIIGRTIPLPVF